MFEMLLEQSGAIVAIIGAIFGGSVIGGLIKYLKWSDSSQSSFREELREEISDLRDRVEKYRDNVDDLNDRIMSLEQQLYESHLINQRLTYQIEVLIGHLNKERLSNDKKEISYEDIFYVSFDEVINTDERSDNPTT